MEFIVHMPVNINLEGPLGQTWNAFHQKFKYYQSTELQRTALAEVSSLLLFAAHHQIEALCAALNVFDMNFPKLNAILQVVEETCMPYFILLFERFRYFSLSHNISSQEEERTNNLKQQIEICELTNLKEGILTHALCGSLNNGVLLQHLSNPDGIHMDDIKALYNEIEKAQHPEEDTINNKVPVTVLVKPVVTEEEKLTKTKKKKIHEIKSIEESQDVFLDEKNLNSTYEVTVKVVNELSMPRPGNAEGTQVVASTKLIDTSRNVKALTSKLKDKSKVVKTPTTKLIDTSKIVKSPTTKLKNTPQDVVKKESISSESFEKEPKKRFYCCFCDKSFVGTICLRRHLTKTHNGNQGYPCWICQTTYPDVEEYLSLSHWTTVHSSARLNPNGPQPELKGINLKRKYVRLSSFPCTTCNQVFSQGRILQAHVQRDHCRSYMCWCCDQHFNILSDYKIHLTEHLTTRKFSCDLCNRQSSSLTGLYYHLHKHLVPRIKCHICGYTFVKSESLAIHIQEHVMGPAHICNICGKSFVTNFRLQLHISSHTGEKKFTCELCGKSYTNRNNLVYHKRWHTGERPKKCEYCDKDFRCTGDLIKHRRKHYDQSAFICDVCGRGFSYKHGLVRHRLKHSGKRSYACKVCGRTFIYNSGLTDHIKANRCPGKKKE